MNDKRNSGRKKTIREKVVQNQFLNSCSGLEIDFNDNSNTSQSSNASEQSDTTATIEYEEASLSQLNDLSFTPTMSQISKRSNVSPIHEHSYQKTISEIEYVCCKYCDAKFKKTSGTNVVLTHLRNKHEDKCMDCIEKNIKKKGAINSIIEEVLLMSFITGNLPFRFLENRYFKQFISLLNNSYKLPSRHDLSGDTLNRVYDLTAAEVSKDLKAAQAVAISTDCWTSVQDFSYLGLTSHFINKNFELANFVLAIKHVQASTAEELKKVIISILTEWGILEKTLAVVTDNEPTMMLCVEKLKYEVLKYSKFGYFFGIHCLGHVLHLVVEKLFELDLYEGI